MLRWLYDNNMTAPGSSEVTLKGSMKFTSNKAQQNTTK